MDCDQRLARQTQRGGIRARRVPAQGHDREDADDSHEDERALDDSSGEVAERETLDLAFEDREQR